MAAVKNISDRSALLFANFDESDEQAQNDDEVLNILKKTFGYERFRPLQRKIIQNVLDGRDTLAVLPTGGGKSLCYQIPSLILNGLTLVISPLIALMQDQVRQLEAVGIPAVFLNSSLENELYIKNYNLVQSGKIKLLYVSPEALQTSRIKSLLHSPNIKIACITIDEAHCISEWGHDFRPDYLEIANLRREFPKAVFLALTATATSHVQNDIVHNLKMETPQILVSSFNRPNLYLHVMKKQNPNEQVLQFLRENKGQSGIVYCFSRRQVDTLTEYLVSHGIFALNYHAGLSDFEREAHQNDFISDKATVMVATLAFGMGINKPDVRFVIHYDLPKSIEQYYQEIGRAGRDGLPAVALLLYSPQDVHKIRYFFEQKDDSEKEEALLQKMILYAETKTCRRLFLLSYFGESGSIPTGNYVERECCCDICSSKKDDVPLSDVTIQTQKYLSCILRTRENYGASYVIDVLMGSKASRIREHGDDRLSTWGIGRDLTRNDWLELNSCLLDAGYLEKSEKFNVLHVTELGHLALRNGENIMLPINFSEKQEHRKLSKPKSGEVYKIDSSDSEANRIAEELRCWRRKTADDLNVPPYVIFGDKTLLSIANKKPRSTQELLSCYGIGETKAEHFGTAILRIVSGDS